MRNKLKITDFIRTESHETLGHSYTYKLPSGGEIVLESCLGGYCVAKYDSRLELIGEKKCTDIPNYIPLHASRHKPIYAFSVAIEIANQLLNED